MRMDMMIISKSKYESLFLLTDFANHPSLVAVRPHSYNYDLRGHYTRVMESLTRHINGIEFWNPCSVNMFRSEGSLHRLLLISNCTLATYAAQ